MVTGGAGDPGLAIAQRPAQERATLALLDRDRSRLDRVAAEMSDVGITARSYETDVAEEISVRRSIDALQVELGPPAILVNSAGIVGPTNTAILNYGSDQFDRIYGVNLRGSFLMTKYVLSAMLAQSYGRILLIASIAGKEGNPGMCGYSATKSGVIGLVKGIAKEFPAGGMTINGLASAVVMTDMVRAADPAQVDYMTARIPMKRCGALDEVASISTWIVSRECSFTTGFIFDLLGGRATY